MENDSRKSNRGASCMVMGVVMLLLGLYWMWLRPGDDNKTTVAVCCFCASAILFFNRARQLRQKK